jgi:biopolymer transport protein TolR
MFVELARLFSRSSGGKTMHRKRSRRPQFLKGIDFWAFLSVELVLLMIFMANAPPLHTHSSRIDFVRTHHAKPMPGALREDAMLVVVTRDGNFFFGNLQVRSTELSRSIQECLRRGSERKVYLQVDARARYGDAAAVLEQVRQAGIENIGIITYQR